MATERTTTLNEGITFAGIGGKVEFNATSSTDTISVLVANDGTGYGALETPSERASRGLKLDEVKDLHAFLETWLSKRRAL